MFVFVSCELWKIPKSTMAAEISLINVKVSSTLGTSRTRNTINDYWMLTKNWDLSVVSRSIICRSRRKWQIIAACKTNFLQYYKIISAIPNQLLLKARQLDSIDKEFFTSNDTVLITILEWTWKKRNHETFTNCSLTKLTLGPHWSKKIEPQTVFNPLTARAFNYINYNCVLRWWSWNPFCDTRTCNSSSQCWKQGGARLERLFLINIIRKWSWFWTVIWQAP